VHRLFTPLLRRVYVLFAAFLLVYGAFVGWQYSHWNKERLFRKLVNGERRENIEAAFDLVYLKGEEQLLRALRERSVEVRGIAMNSLWDLWSRAAGADAYQSTVAAGQAADRDDFDEALRILDHVVAAHPGFAEGWNRRATVYWMRKEYHRSILDCRRAISLNPRHFGAWQGMGVCQAYLGDMEAAVISLRIALKIVPYDAGLRQMLRHCEDLLRWGAPDAGGGVSVVQGPLCELGSWEAT
jgi:tetratricopeptide (TPR) repeat protein